MDIKVAMKNGRACGANQAVGKKGQVGLSLKTSGILTLEKEADSLELASRKGNPPGYKAKVSRNKY